MIVIFYCIVLLISSTYYILSYDQGLIELPILGIWGDETKYSPWESFTLDTTYMGAYDSEYMYKYMSSEAGV